MNKAKSPKPITYSLALLSLSVAMRQGVVLAATEEQQLVEIAKKLKPISDSQWSEIASSHIKDTYEVQKGDNLWNISRSLFGNPFYWPKVWTLNNHHIGNPHIITPGQKLVFSAGSSESMPNLSTGDGESTIAGAKTSTEAAVAADEKRAHDHEYDKLSPEAYAPEDSSMVSSDYEGLGIDRDIKIELENHFSFRVPALINDNTLPSLGEIVGSRREGVGLSENETVFIKSFGQDLQVGSYYSVFSDPQRIAEKRSDRTGYSYNTIGELHIIGVKDELYVAEVSKSQDVIKRGDKVYPLLPLVTEIKPTSARNSVESMVLFDPVYNGTNASQFRYVFFDRGLEDGVEVGNVFRIYDYYDPVTGKKITDSDFLHSADVIVIHATAQFSTGLILKSKSTITKGDIGVLLTDTSDLSKAKGDKTKSLDGKSKDPDKDLDDLDELDRISGEGLGRKEEQEVKELDQWDKTKDLEPSPTKEIQPQQQAPQTQTSQPDTLVPPSETPETPEPLEPLASPEGEAPSAGSNAPIDAPTN